MRPVLRRWFTWLITLFVVSVAGMILLPVVRKYPEGVHSFFSSAHNWQRWLLSLALSIAVVFVLDKMLSPRLAHLREARHLPPVWTAWLVAALIVCVVDLVVGLGPRGFHASVWQWLLLAIGPVIAVRAYRWLTSTEPPSPEVAGPVQEKSLDELIGDWPALEQWLRREQPANIDLLGNLRVSRRLAQYLVSPGGTIGLVGLFGCGKTTVVKWLKQEVEGRDLKVWFCEFSCWGFEDSASAVQQILTRAVDVVGQHADCFSIRHLPELYRKMFSAGGDWIRNLADLLIGSADPIGQIRMLSEILTSLSARLVVIVEDLDRTNSSRFDRQEVLALLHRLKEFEGLSFILSASLTFSADIGFAKLCDHIEQLPEIDGERIAAIIQAVRGECLKAFSNDRNLSAGDDPWKASPYTLLVRFDRISPPRAAARLLRTPRALKHALGRTYRAWQRLHGEVDFDHLLAVNILRHGAPGAFDFLLRHWIQLYDDPRQWSTGRDQVQGISSKLKSEWQEVIRGSEWDPRSAIALIEFLLPQSAEYLGEDGGAGGSRFRAQGIGYRRYWDRITNEDIDPNQARDQVVLHDLHDWLSIRASSSTLVQRIYEGGDYLNQWEHHAPAAFAQDPAALLQLSEQVLTRLRTAHGARASGDDTHDAFVALWRCANRQVPRGPESREWLERQIREAMPHSLALVVDLYYYWASGTNGIVRLEDREHIRRLVYELCKQQFHSGEDLIRVLHPEIRYDIYWLVFPPDDHEGPSALRGFEDWQWLGPVLLDGLRRDPQLIAPKIGHLISERGQGNIVGQEVYQVVPERLSGFFDDDANELIRLLKTARDGAEGADRDFLDQVVRSALTQ